MSGRVLVHPHADSRDIWKGYARVSQAGVALAITMLDELADIESERDGITAADRSSLEDWPRHGQPFRNIVAEYLKRARAQGETVERGFCAVLSDLAAMIATGTLRDVSDYADWYHIEEGQP